MTLENLGALGEFLGFFAVLATLIYLSIQTNQAKQIARAEAVHSLFMNLQENLKYVGSDPALVNIVRKGMTDWSSLNDEEKCRANSYFTAWFLNYSSAAKQEHQGPEFKQALKIIENNFIGILLCPGAREWWSYQALVSSSSNSNSVTCRINARLADPENHPPSWAEYAPWWIVSDKNESVLE